jgi:ankyrin repeat protein
VKDNDGGWTRLHRVAYNGHEAVVRLLVENGADIEAQDADEGTALHWAAKNGHKTVVQLLLENRAETGLKWAAENGYEAVVRLLLENGADMEASHYR